MIPFPPDGVPFEHDCCSPALDEHLEAVRAARAPKAPARPTLLLIPGGRT